MNNAGHKRSRDGAAQDHSSAKKHKGGHGNNNNGGKHGQSARSGHAQHQHRNERPKQQQQQQQQQQTEAATEKGDSSAATIQYDKYFDGITSHTHLRDFFMSVIPLLTQRTGSPPPLPPILDAALEAQVFTHSSTVPDNPSMALQSYERLEWLGDAYIETAATKAIFTRFTTLPVGTMSALRETLVRNATLCALSKLYGFPGRVTFNSAAQRAALVASDKWAKICGDVFEAYVAGVVLSHGSTQGAAVVEAWLEALWEPVFAAFVPPKPRTNAAARLNTFLGGQRMKVSYQPYRPMDTAYGPGRQCCYLAAVMEGWGFPRTEIGRGEGGSMAKAREAACEDALENGNAVVRIARERKVKFDEAKAGGASAEELEELRKSWTDAA